MYLIVVPSWTVPEVFSSLPTRTDIEIALVVIGEIGAGELAVRRHFALIPDGDVRIDAAPDQPAEHLAGAIGDVGGQLVH
jgi:hypothetical protein